MWTDWRFAVAAILAVTLVGLAKGGLSGLGVLGTPLLALVLPPAQAAATLLPILIVQDVVSVWTSRHDWDRWVVGWMLPGAMVGVAGGWYFAASMPVAGVLAALGAITLIFGAYRLRVEWGGDTIAPSRSPGWVGALFGVATGFTSHIAHAGSPIFQMWVTPRRLPHRRFSGTGAILFAAINWTKVPAYLALGAFTHQSLTTAIALLPVAIASTLAGVWLIGWIDRERFYIVVHVLMVVLGVKLLWDALG